MAVSRSVQSKVGGVYVAANFAYGVNPKCSPGVLFSGDSTTGAAVSVIVRAPQPFEPASVTLGDGGTLQPYATTAPVTLADANPETVTPTAVSINTDGSVTLTASLTQVHGQGCLVLSGSIGLQEALNEASANGGGVVVLDSQWSNLGGTTAILEAATIPAGVSVLDYRSGVGAARNPVVTYSGTLDAISKLSGVAFISSTAVDAATLAAPVSGTDDGLVLQIVAGTTHAHTVTVAGTTTINGNATTATFSTVGQSLTLVAKGGKWYTVGGILIGTVTLA